ncbi:unnamed protein product [Rhizoctonia solani]|uniref:Glutathione S-transferase UstS-like C-terminal domain-containing protein n=1 Tax=Rhizoctonia solani TaxID=456999 RepID=A0A8H3GQL0_9AGAM|nr:unnamed protein product [Rhizoctonia solani]
MQNRAVRYHHNWSYQPLTISFVENIGEKSRFLPPESTATIYLIRAWDMAATNENPSILYDILSKYDIASKLKALGVRATNPAPYIAYTLPMIADPAPDPNGKPTYVVESFDIAIYLDKTYPAPKYLVVFPLGTRAVQKLISDLFTNEVGYMVMPSIIHFPTRAGFLDERGREHFLKTRTQVFKELPANANIGSTYWGDVYEKWKWFGEILDLNEEGPFVMGKQISFTDFAVGGIISSLRRVEGGGMRIWSAIAEWQGGRWARLWAEIEKLEKGSTEVA